MSCTVSVPARTGLVGGERLENSLPETRGDQILSQFASLLGVKMSFDDEADVGMGCWGRFGESLENEGRYLL